MLQIQTVENDYNFIKGKIAVVIMTFSKDSGCLKQCIRGIEEQIKKGYNLEIFILDDGNSPLNREDFLEYNYRKTYFNRNNNLNGLQCSHGMLIEFLRIARQCRAQYVMKVDSDMYIRSLANFMKPLQENEDLVIGFKLNPLMDYVAGVTYLLPSKGLYNAIKNFYSWYSGDIKSDGFIPHYPEDRTITRCISETNNYTLYQWQNSVNPHSWLLAPFNFNEVETSSTINPLILSRFTMYDFVNFGNRHEIKDQQHSRTIAAYWMKTFIDFDLLNTHTIINNKDE